MTIKSYKYEYGVSVERKGIWHKILVGVEADRDADETIDVLQNKVHQLVVDEVQSQVRDIFEGGK